MKSRRPIRAGESCNLADAAYLVIRNNAGQSARLFAERATAAQKRERKHMGEHLDALFNRAATGHHDIEFLCAVHNYHFICT